MDRTFTVVTAAFQAEATLSRAIESVLSQSWPNWLMVVVDDGSTDATGAIADAYQRLDSRLTVLHQANGGVACARNSGVALATTEFLVFLDADDCLSPEYMRKMSEFIDVNPGYDIYHPNLDIVFEDGSREYFSDCSQPVSYSFHDLLEECVIALGGACVRGQLIRRLGGFDPAIHCEDYDLWLRATASGARALYLPQPLYEYHMLGTQRRSVDVLGGIQGYVASINKLRASGLLPVDLEPRIQTIIERKQLPVASVLSGRELDAQASWLRERLERVLGPQGARVALSGIHSLSWLVHPVRRHLAGRRASKMVRKSAADTGSRR